MTEFNVGDKVTFNPKSLLHYWKVNSESVYVILDITGNLFTILNDEGQRDTYHMDYLNDLIVQDKPELPAAIPTAWKIDQIHFTDEGNGNISIFGNGDITISIESLKTILETVKAT